MFRNGYMRVFNIYIYIYMGGRLRPPPPPGGGRSRCPPPPPVGLDVGLGVAVELGGCKASTPPPPTPPVGLDAQVSFLQAEKGYDNKLPRISSKLWLRNLKQRSTPGMIEHICSGLHTNMCNWAGQGPGWDTQGHLWSRLAQTVPQVGDHTIRPRGVGPLARYI